jgi:type IV fimbrial biogenesis protein FimT
MSVQRSGLSIVELLVVLALVGILVAAGIVQFNFAGVATRQAAQVLTSAVNRARIEAIRSNSTAGLVVVAADDENASGLIRVCRNVDPTTTLACPANAEDPDYVLRIDFAGGDLGRARLLDSGAVFFDRRGVMRNPTTVTIRVSDRAGENLRTVEIQPTGRATVQ